METMCSVQSVTASPQGYDGFDNTPEQKVKASPTKSIFYRFGHKLGQVLGGFTLDNQGRFRSRSGGGGGQMAGVLMGAVTSLVCVVFGIVLQVFINNVTTYFSGTLSASIIQFIPLALIISGLVVGFMSVKRAV